MITVKQLIEELSKYDEDAVVIVYDDHSTHTNITCVIDDFFLLYKDGQPLRYRDGEIVCIDGYSKEHSMEFICERYLNNEVPDKVVRAVKIF